jgi:FkbM family methyltransferase
MEYRKDKFLTPWGSEIQVLTREGTNDWNTLYSCLVQDEYKVGDLKDVSGVAVDIGAHAGGCTLALLSRGFHVISVEPLPENTDLIMRNVDLNGWSKNITLYKKAINKESGGSVILRYGNEKTQSGNHHRFIGNTVDSSGWVEGVWQGGREIQVETISIDDILKNIDSVAFLKIDCEGAEWSAFSGASRGSLLKIKAIAAELHGVDEGKDMYKEFQNLIGKEFKDKTLEKFKDLENHSTIGLAYFEK